MAGEQMIFATQRDRAQSTTAALLSISWMPWNYRETLARTARLLSDTGECGRETSPAGEAENAEDSIKRGVPHRPQKLSPSLKRNPHCPQAELSWAKVADSDPFDPAAVAG